MAFDFKKEYKELYTPATKPTIVIVPVTNYVLNPIERKIISFYLL